MSEGIAGSISKSASPTLSRSVRVPLIRVSAAGCLISSIRDRRSGCPASQVGRPRVQCALRTRRPGRNHASPARVSVTHRGRENNFATVIFVAGGHISATRVPLILEPAREPNGTLLGHVARANPQWRSFNGEMEVIGVRWTACVHLPKLVHHHACGSHVELR
jgi:hypothetical protein